MVVAAAAAAAARGEGHARCNMMRAMESYHHKLDFYVISFFFFFRDGRMEEGERRSGREKGYHWNMRIFIYIYIHTITHIYIYTYTYMPLGGKKK